MEIGEGILKILYILLQIIIIAAAAIVAVLFFVLIGALFGFGVSIINYFKSMLEILTK